ncbi:TlyA family rRNA (cytidine-2'-O)-methyltransferase, partial [bacterium]|nr:TlyA family rRNA (cytidine-2'-O)-methyltransferase [bacterium]
MNSGNETLADKLVAHSHFESSDEAARWIRRGRVIVNGERVYDPEATVAQDSDIKIIRRDSRYVSRGGLKLE